MHSGSCVVWPPRAEVPKAMALLFTCLSLALGAGELAAATPSQAELLECEMRAAARIITGYPRSTPAHALMAEAGLAPVEERRKVLAARLLGGALALPPTVPLHETAETTAPSRLSSVRGWRTLGRQMLAEAEATPLLEPELPPYIPPWERGGDVTFRLDVQSLFKRTIPADTRFFKTSIIQFRS